MQINIGGGHQLEDAQPSDTPSASAPAEAAAAAPEQEADAQSSDSSEAQEEAVAVPAGLTASNKRRKVVPVAALGRVSQDPDDRDGGNCERDSVGALRQGKCFFRGGGKSYVLHP